ncbi:transforming growth factor beta regulator 1-like [Argonauta hians]
MTPDQGSRDYYFRKWKRMKKDIKDKIFVNAAICDEVVRIEEKVLQVKEERRFLLHKLLQFQSANDTMLANVKLQATTPAVTTNTFPTILKVPATMPVPQQVAVETTVTSSSLPTKPKVKKKITERKKTVTELLEEKSKPKKTKTQISSKKIVPPIPLDPLGRPVFPLSIGDLTIHSLGEIVPDRPNFHSEEYIFPIGFCSTRLYVSTRHPDQKCLYTCSISDGGNGPLFEISADDQKQILCCRDSSECHSKLLHLINQSRGYDLVATQGAGPEFFGLSHPIVQNLIQSCPGARKCSLYKWIKFEVSKTENICRSITTEDDPTISVEALRTLQSVSQGSKFQT